MTLSQQAQIDRLAWLIDLFTLAVNRLLHIGGDI